MTTIQIPEQSRRLGRHVNHDPRSLNFPAETAEKLTSVTHRGGGKLPLDQGQIGSCTGNALAGALDLAPNWKAGDKIYLEPDAVQLYEWETALEGSPYPPNDPGGSGLNVCKVAKQHFWISSYTHATSIQQALLALVLRPVITGVNWYTQFDTPASDGQVSIGGSVRGGHEFVAHRMDVPAGATVADLDDINVWFTNSWGPQFAIGGRFYMKASTWATLLSQQGDVTVPVK